MSSEAEDNVFYSPGQFQQEEIMPTGSMPAWSNGWGLGKLAESREPVSADDDLDDLSAFHAEEVDIDALMQENLNLSPIEEDEEDGMGRDWTKALTPSSTHQNVISDR